MEVNRIPFPVQKCLGAGGYGAAYLIKHPDWGDIAFKTLSMSSSNSVELLTREANIHKKLHHPNVVILYDSYVNSDVCGLFLEYMKYGAVDEFLEIFDATTWQWKVKIVHDVAAGMCYLHNQVPPILHGDLKSQNILIGEGYRAKISDFGFAHTLDMSGSETHQRVSGTIEYIAPEYLSGPNRKKDEKFDIYAYAISVWEILTNKPAYHDFVIKQLIAHFVEKGERPEIKDINENIPKSVLDLVKDCWREAFEERPTFERVKSILAVEIARIQNELANSYISLMHQDLGHSSGQLEIATTAAAVPMENKLSICEIYSLKGKEVCVTGFQKVCNSLVRYMDPDNGLLWCLKDKDVLKANDIEQLYVLKASKEHSFMDLNEELLRKYIEPKIDASCLAFLDALNENDQRHIALHIINGGRNFEDEERLLTQEETDIINDNMFSLVKLVSLYRMEFLRRLVSKKCITDRHKESIDILENDDRKIDKLLTILKRRSYKDFHNFKGCLHDTMQHRVINILEFGGVVTVRVELQNRVDRQIIESKLIDLLTGYVDKNIEVDKGLTPEQILLIEDILRVLEESNIHLIGNCAWKSMAVFFQCTTKNSFEKLIQLHETEILKATLEQVFKHLLDPSETTSVLIQDVWIVKYSTRNGSSKTKHRKTGIETVHRSKLDFEDNQSIQLFRGMDKTETFQRVEELDHTSAQGELVYKRAEMSQSGEKQSITTMLQQKLRDKPNIFLSKVNIKEYQKMPRHLFQKIIRILETSRQEDPDYFWRDVSKANFLTFLYLHRSSEMKKKDEELNRESLEKVKELIRESLVKDSCNFNGLANKIWLLVDQGKHEEAEYEIEEFEKMTKESDAEFCQLVSLGEVAYGFTQTEPIYYMHAINIYEQVLTRFQQTKNRKYETTEVQEKLITWKYHLAQTYNKLLNPGNKKILQENGISFEFAYNNITLHMGDIIEKKHAFYGGKAMVDLAEAYKKVQNIFRDVNNRFPCNLLNEDDQMNRAYQDFKHDPYVLQMVGRHFQQKSEKACTNSEERLRDCRKAVKTFEEACEVCSFRHVTWHHLGLTYRLLWLLQTNPFSDRKEKVHKKKQTDKADKDLPIERRMIPNYQTDPTYFDEFRSLNPKLRKRDHSECLEKALSCMKKANDLANSTCCKYLVDLARIYISFGKFKDADDSFKNAETACTNDNDGAYLYEQWGILKESVSRDGAVHGMENVKLLYRNAIKCAVKAKVWCKMALFNLRNIIKEELEREECKKEEKDWSINEPKRLEYFLLYDTIEEYGHVPNALKEAVSKETRNLANITRLIEVSHHSVASTYMTVIMNSECLNQTQKLANLKKYLEIAKSGTEYYRNFYQVFGDIFKWIVGKENLYQRTFKVKRPNTGVCAPTDICLVSPNDNNATANDLSEMFMKCNLEVSRYPDDAFPGEDREEKLSQLIGNSKMVLVVWEVADDAFKILLGRCTADLTEKHACLILTGNVAQDVEDIPYNKWPSCQWKESEDTNKTDMFHSLLSNILSRQ